MTLHIFSAQSTHEVDPDGHSDINSQVDTQCLICDEIHEIRMTASDYLSWKVMGNYVQEVFPHLSASAREIAISGTCPECWDRMYADM